LNHIDKESKYYAEAQNLKNRLSEFISLPESAIPRNSLLNEFIG
jgi:hypothetical protein